LLRAALCARGYVFRITVGLAVEQLSTLNTKLRKAGPEPHALCKALSEISIVEKKNSEGKSTGSPAAFFSDNQSFTKSFAAARDMYDNNQLAAAVTFSRWECNPKRVQAQLPKDYSL
jgi:hypothetical protein